MKTKHGTSTWFWFSEPRDICTRMTFKAANETKTIVVIPGEAKQDYFYAVYPRKDGEPEPNCTALGPGVMRIKTTESTDVVFIGDTPVRLGQEDVTFSGKAGAVRVFANRVVLSMNAGSGKIGYRGLVVEGHGPFEEVVSLSQVRQPGVHRRDGGEEALSPVGSDAA